MTITDAMSEDAAQALRDVVAARSPRTKPWDRLPDNIRAMYRREAEAAIRAAWVHIENRRTTK